MGNCNPKKNKSSINNKFINYFNIDKNIMLGTWNNPNHKSDMSHQGIKIDKCNIHSLVYVMKVYGTSSIIYNFENNIKLIIEKDKSLNYIYTLIYNNIKKCDIINCDNFKIISKNSKELDMIFSL